MPSNLVKVGDCTVHGLVAVTNIYDTSDPSFTTGDMCTKCYLEWLKENVNKVTAPRMMEVRVP